MANEDTQLTPVTEQATPQSTEQVTPGAVNSEVAQVSPNTTPNWDSDENPYKYTASRLQELQNAQREQSVQNGIREQAAKLQEQGAAPEAVRAFVENQWGQYQLSRQQESLQQQARPVVARMLSEKISAQYGVTITAEELLQSSTGTLITNPEAMLARADALIHERRRTASQHRATTGADKVGRVETAVSAPDPARFAKMTPAQLIAEGLKRQQSL